MYRYAIYRKDKSYLFDVKADSESQALRIARLQTRDAEIAILVVPGNDLGVNGL